MSNKPVATFPCRICGRKFANDSLTKHESICSKLAKKKRRVFNSLKQRISETGISVQQAERALKRPDPVIRPRGGGWRREHAEFIAAIRTAKMMTQAEKTGQPLPASFYKQQVPSAPREDLVLCPHCGRRFNDTSAERHIPFCKQQHERVDGRAEKQQRLAARTQFKPPPPAPPPVQASPVQRAAPNLNGTNGSYAATYAGLRAEAGSNRSSVNRSSTRPTAAPVAQSTISTQPMNRTSLSTTNVTYKSNRVNGTPSSGLSGKVSSSSIASSGSVSQSIQSKIVRASGNPPPSSYSGSSTKFSSTTAGTGRNIVAVAPTQTTAVRKPAAAPQASGKFCHECGSAFPTSQMKYCMDCGAKRLTIS